MNRTSKLLILCAFTLLSCVYAGTASADDYMYAITNMTWAEFYAGEVDSTSADLFSAGLDAISSPTARIANRFTQLTSESNDIGGRSITGVADVQVRMDETAYSVLSSDSRFTFVDETFTEYKDANADGSFGKMITETHVQEGATVTLTSPGTWGDYVLAVSSIDVTVSSGDEYYYLGALVETSDGSVYGMRHNNNLWFSAKDLAISTAEFVEVHGVSRSYEYTSDMEGKTITKITYMLKNLPDEIVNCNVFLKLKTSASVAPEYPEGYNSFMAGQNVQVPLVFADIPSSADYSLSSVTFGTGRNRKTISGCTMSGDVLTIAGTVAGGTYTAVFSDETYANISAVIKVDYMYATTNMTWAEFYAGEVDSTSADLFSAGLDAISSPTARIANRFTQLTSESNDIGGRSITGVADVQVRMDETAYSVLSSDSRFTFVDETFTEYKDANADGSFGKMITETHVQEGATVTLTSPGTWGDYVLAVSSIDVTVSSGDEYYYLGALVETSDGSVYGMRHNNNLWFSAKDLAISTAEFVEVHGVSRSYKYTSDMEGKTITKITYMLKNLPDEIVSCDVFLKLKTSASVAPEYPEGYHAFMAGQNIQVPLVFADIPSSADYSLSSVTFGTGRNRKTVSGCTMSGDVLTIAGIVSEGTYTAVFSDETYANISAVIKVYTTNVTDKIISADKNAARLSFLLTPQGICDSTDEVLDAQNFVNATEYTTIADNSTSIYTGGTNQIEGSGFSLQVVLNNVPDGKKGILGFSHAFQITPEKIGITDFTGMSAKILALPDVAYGWRVPTGGQLKDMGLTVVSVYPDGVSRDITDYISSGLYVSTGNIMMSFGTVLIDRAFTPSEEGKVYQLSDEGEGTMSDGRFDGKITATWYVRTPIGSGSSSSDDKTDGGKTDGGSITPANPTVLPSKPSEAMTTEAKQSEIKTKLSTLSSKVTGDTVVELGLPDSAIKGSQSVISPDSDVVYLPVIEVTEAKIYVFGVSLDKLVPGAAIFWNSNAVNVSTGEFVSAADAEEAVIFFARNGDETSVVPSDRFVNVAAYLEPGLEYSPTISTVQIPDAASGVSSSSGGCNSVELTLTTATMMSILLILAYISKKR